MLKETRLSYDSDLTDAEWALVGPLLPPHPPWGNDPRIPKREILSAIFYVNKHGCAWRGLPHDSGRQCMATFACGPRPEFGSGSTLPSATQSVWPRAKRPNQPPRSSIANR